MKLHRYVLARFRPELPQIWDNRGTDANGVTVRLRPATGTGKHPGWRLVSACTALDNLPPLDEQMRILVPERERGQCELLAGHVINTISVIEGCAKAIVSPLHCVALEPLDANEREYLESSNGIKADYPAAEHAVDSRIEWSPEIAQALSDRMDGVALLSEAFSARSDGATYRDLVRFLELAFSLAAYEPKFKASLSGYFGRASPYGYTEVEFDEWINLRHPSTHADLKRTKWIALGADVRHVVLRMRQACLDVLFNKEEWRSPSQNRRAVWTPDALTSAPNGMIVARQGSALRMVFRSMDEFGVYPCLIEVSVDHKTDSLYATYFQDPRRATQESPGGG